MRFRPFISTIALLGSLLPTPAFGTVFPDLPGDPTLRGPVEALTTQGIITGYPDGLFRPVQSVSWGEWAKLVLNARDVVQLSVQPITLDASTTAAAVRSVQEGLLSADTAWDAPAPRIEAIAFLARAYGLTGAGTFTGTNPFVDVPAEQGALFGNLARLGIIRGVDATHLGTHALLRQEAAKLLRLAMGQLVGASQPVTIIRPLLRLIAMTRTTFSPGDTATILFAMQDSDGDGIAGMTAADFRLIILQGSVVETGFSEIGSGVYEYTIQARPDGPPGPIQLRIVTTTTATYQALEIPGSGTASQSQQVGLTVTNRIVRQGTSTTFIAIPRAPNSGSPVSGLTLRAAVVAGGGTISQQPVESPAGSGVYVGEYTATGVGEATIRVQIESIVTQPYADVTVVQV